jgi:predicted DCC family thiol-disulfide oxidoreductase YuxK
MNISYPLTIYYDASCALCASEMHTLKSLDANNQLILIDCSSDVFSEPSMCPTTKAGMLERIYAVDANGQWISGIDVFEAAYAMSGFERISRVFGNKRIRPILDILYPWVVKNRSWLSKTPLPYLLNKSLNFVDKY